MQIGLMSDTHGFLDESLFAYFEACDEIWHAGDVGAGVINRLQGFKPVRAVFGNIDGEPLRSQLPEDLVWCCEQVPVYITHIGGYPGHYDPRAKREIVSRRPALFICGHSHIPRVMRDPKFGLLHLNPGACGNAGWHTERTAMRFIVEGEKISGVELLKLGRRGR